MEDAPGNRIERRRLWPARVISLLLLLEGALFLGIAVHGGLQVDWERELLEKALSRQIVFLLTTTGFLVPLAALAILAAVGFVLIRPSGWFLAMVVQGLTLLSSLVLHFREGPGYLYILMAVGVLMAFYINSSPVRVLFHRNNKQAENDDTGE